MCTAAAGFVTLMFRDNSFKTILPVLFLAIIVFSAVRFGNVAGLLSTVFAATIFAAFLFEPTLSLGVKDSAQRSNLIWMIVGGLIMSELLGNPPQQRPHL
jgi:K+-sensing histidine kinase KdpD